MHVAGDAGATIEFSAYELGERALAWIVEERALRAALLPLAFEAGVDGHRRRRRSSALDWTPDAGTLDARRHDGSRARADGEADRRRRWRALVGPAGGGHRRRSRRPYGQTAVVANFACERAHHGVARQWFRADGSVLAWLPLPGRRISIVWSAPDALAAELRGAGRADALAARVADAGGHALGRRLTPITAAAGFPLAFLKLPATIAPPAGAGRRCRAWRPSAGRPGRQPGIRRRARRWRSVLAERGPVADPGAPMLLERFARRRAEPVLAMQTVTDGLARLFGPPAPWLQDACATPGMTAVDRLPLLKRALAQPALR